MIKEQSRLAQQDGVVVVHKPKGITSAACIAKIKHGLQQKKIGHAGTLDPMAEGVLLVLLGQATKISQYLMDEGEKVYSGIIHLGVTTDTWDAEGTVVAERSVEGITEEAVRASMAELVGTYEQEVPPYSAAKHKGKPLYALARKGLETPVKYKVRTIFCGEIESVNLPQVRFRVTCSSGTYIRSLAHSLGKRLGCGAMLQELLREYSHPFGLDAACSLDVLEKPEEFASYVINIADALPAWPHVALSAAEVEKVRNGMLIDASDAMPPATQALLLDTEGVPLALALLHKHEEQAKWKVLRGLWT